MAWGQTDYSGTYYIASSYSTNNSNVNYNSTDPTQNFYLCPTDEENWICYVDPDNYTNPASDNDQPFLTTFKYRSGAEGVDATKAIWIIEKVSNSDNYHIKHKYTNRYLTYNGPINTTSGTGTNRLRFHLQSTANDNSLFQIVQDADKESAVNIIAVAAIDTYYYTDKDGEHNNKYLNISSTDQNTLVGSTGKKDGPADYKNVGATIGIWYDTGRSSEWYLEEVLARPTFSSSSSSQITISHAEENASIYYTTDGTRPTTTNNEGSGPAPLEIEMLENSANLKAIAMSDDMPSCISEIRVVPNATVTLASSSFTYNGSAQEPAVTVKDGDTTISSDEYTVSYSNNTNAGDATITITNAIGGNYIVYSSTTFTISPKSLGDGDIIAEGITIKLTSEGALEYVKDGETTLQEDVDYTCDIQDEGSDKIIEVTGIGNYTGSFSGIYANPVSYATDGDGGTTVYVAVYMASRDFDTPTGVETYIVKTVNPSIGTLTTAKLEYIPKDVPVLLISETEISGFIATEKDESIEEITEETKNSNKLKVAPTGGVPIETAQAYMFYLGEFVMTKAGTIKAGKFYVYNPSFTANPSIQGSAPLYARLMVVEEKQEVSTAISEMGNTSDIVDSWYTLDGRRLNGKPSKQGLYLQNGRKMVIQ